MTTLTTLGGSSAAISVGQGCAGYLIEHANTTVVLDLGPNTLLELRKHTDLRTLDALVISHLHMDHVFDALALRDTLVAISPRREQPLPVWLPTDGIDLFAKAAAIFAAPQDRDTYFAETHDLREVDPSLPLTVGGLTITFARTVHAVPCWAMRVSPRDGSGDLVYTADTSDIAGLVDFAQGAKVVISEATYAETPAPEVSRSHISAEEAGILAQTIGAETLVLTHIWEQTGPEAQRTRAAAAFTGTIAIARPGVTIAW